MSGTGDLRIEVGKLKSELASLCSSLDPDLIPLHEVTSIWKSFDAMERLATGAKCRLARRVEESGSWQAKGARSPAEHQAQLAGTTTGRARAALESSKRLAGLPEADEALANGELSDQQASAITEAATADPSAEARLVELARRGDLRTLREDCARVRARAEDEAKRTERLHRQRSLGTWTGADGSWNLMAKSTPEVGAVIDAALAPLKETIFQAARLAGDHESGEAYGADALAEMARRSVAAEDAGLEDRAPADPDSKVDGAAEDHAEAEDHRHQSDAGPGGPSGADTAADDTAADDPEAAGPEAGAAGRRAARSRRPDTKVIALISYEALKRGWAEAEETSEIAGVGPVSVATVRSLLGDAFGAAIVTNGVDVFTVAHLGRSVSAHQRSALEARGYHCEVPGCGSTTALEIDHIDEWSKTFATKLDGLCWLCKRHHADKTHRGWRLLGTAGERRWVHVGAATLSRDAPGPEPPGSAQDVASDPEPPTLFGDPSAA